MAKGMNLQCWGVKKARASNSLSSAFAAPVRVNGGVYTDAVLQLFFPRRAKKVLLLGRVLPAFAGNGRGGRSQLDGRAEALGAGLGHPTRLGAAFALASKRFERRSSVIQVSHQADLTGWAALAASSMNRKTLTALVEQRASKPDQVFLSETFRQILQRGTCELVHVEALRAWTVLFPNWAGPLMSILRALACPGC